MIPKIEKAARMFEALVTNIIKCIQISKKIRLSRAEVAGPVEKMQQSLFINRPFLNFLAVN